MNRLWALAAVFTPLSVATIGGGQAIVADIQRQAVDVHGWMTTAEFVNAFAISRLAPGPGALLVTLVGWRVAGWGGALVATVAIFAPTAIMITVVAHVWSRYRGARWQAALEGGLRPVAAGMVLAAVYVLLQSLEGGWLARGIALAATAALLRTRVNPLALMGLGALVFWSGRGAFG